MTPAELDLTDCDFPCACDRHRRPAPAQTTDQLQPAAGPAITFAGCARCGGAHADLPTERLIRPFAPADITAQVWSHWALCPVTRQPILVAMVDDPQGAAPKPAARVFPPGDHRGIVCRACEAAVGEPCVDLPRRIDAPRMCTHDRPHVVRVTDARGVET